MRGNAETLWMCDPLTIKDCDVWADIQPFKRRAYDWPLHTLKDRLRVKHANKLMTRYRYGGQFESLDNKRTEIIQRYVEMKGSR